MNPLCPLVAERAKGRCEYCHAPEEIFNFAFEVEHLLPVSRGGTDQPDNFALSRNACNRYKSDFTTGIDPETGQEVGLFRPRNEIWSEHFQATIETAEIVRISPTRRATVARLQMNRPHQIIARRRWILLKLFP